MSNPVGTPTRRARHENPNAKQKNTHLPKIIGACVMAAVIAILAWQCSQPKEIEDVLVGDFYEQTASEIQEAVDHEVEDGYFNMSINTSVPVSTDMVALIGIKNIESNAYDCTVTITLEDGTQVYKSGGLAPGTELQSITLDQELETGEYAGTALFEIYEQDEAHTKAGQTASKITLYVQ